MYISTDYVRRLQRLLPNTFFSPIVLKTAVKVRGKYMHPEEPLSRVINLSPLLKSFGRYKIVVQNQNCARLVPLRFYAEAQKSFITRKRGPFRTHKSHRTFVITLMRVIHPEDIYLQFLNGTRIIWNETDDGRKPRRKTIRRAK